MLIEIFIFQIVRGFVAVINSSHLLATDLDNPAADIRYKVIQAPKHGKLHLYDQETTIFTQQDVNENKLKFIQNPHEPSQFDAGKQIVTTKESFKVSSILCQETYMPCQAVCNPVPGDNEGVLPVVFRVKLPSSQYSFVYYLKFIALSYFC